jgi:hypothetical protein
MCLRSIGKIEQLFCNEVIKRCLQPIAQLDFLSSFTLLNPNLVKSLIPLRPGAQNVVAASGGSC